MHYKLKRPSESLKLYLTAIQYQELRKLSDRQQYQQMPGDVPGEDEGVSTSRADIPQGEDNDDDDTPLSIGSDPIGSDDTQDSGSSFGGFGGGDGGGGGAGGDY